MTAQNNSRTRAKMSQAGREILFSGVGIAATAKSERKTLGTASGAAVRAETATNTVIRTFSRVSNQREHMPQGTSNMWPDI